MEKVKNASTIVGFYSAKDPLISIHIPKCGGVSLSNALKKWFGHKLFFHYFDEYKNEMPPRYKLKKWYSRSPIPDICIHGHFNARRGFGVEDYYPEVNQFITFLRDPLEIQLSVFNYNHKIATERGAVYRDGQKAILTPDIDEFLENSSPYIRYFLPHPEEIALGEAYFKKYFIHVGVMENYQTSMNILASKLNKPQISISHENKSERFQIPSASSVKRFTEKCSVEYNLYQAAIKMNEI